MKFVIRTKKDVERLIELIKRGPDAIKEIGPYAKGNLEDTLTGYKLDYLNREMWLGRAWGAWVHLEHGKTEDVWFTWETGHGRAVWTTPRLTPEERVKEILWKDRKHINREFLKHVEWRDDT